VRTRTPGGVGAGGEKPPATRLGNYLIRTELIGLWHATMRGRY